MNDPCNLQRFVAAQQPVYENVCRELRLGSKQSHWMWFIFPQAKGLGRSAMAQKFAISSREEAKAYLEHPSSDPGCGNAAGSWQPSMAAQSKIFLAIRTT
uniref:DUF1810 family protein n=1 Tax=Nitrosovibrio sp. Nv4 TaxID=1945880 RepID=UPI000D46BEBF|nr:DUF1810 family protein [Nitrosovibrio sp. Nv4]